MISKSANDRQKLGCSRCLNHAMLAVLAIAAVDFHPIASQSAALRKEYQLLPKSSQVAVVRIWMVFHACLEVCLNIIGIVVGCRHVTTLHSDWIDLKAVNGHLTPVVTKSLNRTVKYFLRFLRFLLHLLICEIPVRLQPWRLGFSRKCGRKRNTYQLPRQRAKPSQSCCTVSNQRHR